MILKGNEFKNEIDLCADKFINDISNIIERLLVKADINLIDESDGRQKDSCECCKNGSYIYILFNELDKIIYIGETGQSIKHRLFTDGTGSHFQKTWFHNVKYLKYYKNDRMDSKIRKLLERALIAKYNPIHNDGKKTDKN